MLAQYFTEGPYHFSMQFGRGAFREFYRTTSEQILRERKHWLATDPEKHLALLPAAEPLLEEAIRLGLEHDTLPGPEGFSGSPIELAKRLGEQWEPDYLLLTRANDVIRLAGGCVCFPSSWALADKIGQPIEEIHGIVPGLNAAVGRQIQNFLLKLKPGVSWLRSNWGLSRSPELNQHPARNLPRLDEKVALNEVFFRVEEQSLVALPRSGGVLFGIRVKVFPLRDLVHTADADKLAEALATMPEAVARYKGLSTAREQIIELLRA